MGPRFGTLVVVGLAAASVASAQEPPAPPASPGPGLVLFQPPAGTKLAFVRTLEARVVHKIGTKSRGGEGACESELEFAIGAATPQGERPVSVRILRARGWWKHTDQPRVEFDTAAAPVPTDSKARLIADRASPGAFTVRPDGRVVEIESFLRTQSAAAELPASDQRRADAVSEWMSRASLADFAALWPIFAETKAGAGTFFEAHALPPWSQAPFHRLRLRHEVKVLDADRAVFSATGAIEDLDPPKKSGRGAAGDGRLKSSGYASNAEVSRADGTLRRASFESSFVLAKSFGSDGDGTVLVECKGTIARAAPAPAAPAAPGAGK